jgi:hypothetical protein
MLCIYNAFEDSLDQWLGAVAVHRPQLQALVLGSWYIGDPTDGLLAVVQRCADLWYLHIDAKDQALDAFSAAIGCCKNLRSFTLCPGANDGVVHALSNCHKLETVELTDDVQVVSADSIIALAEGCPALHILMLLMRAEVTMDVLRALSRCCAGLTYLEFELTEELHERSEEIASLLPRCEVNWKLEESEGDEGDEDSDNNDASEDDEDAAEAEADDEEVPEEEDGVEDVL